MRVFATLLIILASSLVVIALFRRLQLPPVLGYLCVGLAVGPTALDWVNDSEELPDLAELGVVFLLFSLGLEFSLTKMLSLRSARAALGPKELARLLGSGPSAASAQLATRGPPAAPKNGSAS